MQSRMTLADTRADEMEFRADRDLRAPERTPQGTMRVEMNVATSRVYEYPQADGTVVREYVPPETLADPAAIDSLKLRPLLLAPSDVHWQDVGPEQIEKWRIGQIGEDIRYDADSSPPTLKATAVIDTPRGLSAIENGLRAVSAGYTVGTLDRTAGQAPDGTPYDAIQRDRRYNHVMLVQSGRAGPEAVIRADSDTGDTMDPKKLSALLAPLGITIRADATSEEDVRDAVKAKIDDDAAKIEAAEAKATAAETARGDAAGIEAAVKRGDGEAFRAGYALRARILPLATQAKVDKADTLDTSALVAQTAAKLGHRGDSDASAWLDAYIAVKSAADPFDGLKVRGDAGPVDDASVPLGSAAKQFQFTGPRAAKQE